VQYGKVVQATTDKSGVFNEYFELLSGDNHEEEIVTDITRHLVLVQISLEGSLESVDEYVRGAMEANFDNGYYQDSFDVRLS
jgi:hypothetical protein